MSKPVKPVVPPPALRSEPDTFKDRAEANIEFFEPLVDYMDALADFVDEQADAAVAAAQAGDLPPIAGKAGKLLKVNASGTGLDFGDIPSEPKDFGWGRDGATSGLVISNLDNFSTQKSVSGVVNNTTTGTWPPGVPAGTTAYVTTGRAGSTYTSQVMILLDGSKAFYRVSGAGGTPTAWKQFFDSGMIATQIEAEAGTDNTKVMTPLRTKQAIIAAVGQEIIVTDIKPQGTASQTVVTGYNVRELNTIERNTISGASLASNLISLPAGTYEIDANIATGFVGVCRLKVAGSVSGDLILGAGMNLNNGSLYAQQNIAGTFTLASTENISIEQYVQTARANGAGTYANIAGEAELYARVRIKKLV